MSVIGAISAIGISPITLITPIAPIKQKTTPRRGSFINLFKFYINS